MQFCSHGCHLRTVSMSAVLRPACCNNGDVGVDKEEVEARWCAREIRPHHRHPRLPSGLQQQTSPCLRTLPQNTEYKYDLTGNTRKIRGCLRDVPDVTKRRMQKCTLFFCGFRTQHLCILLRAVAPGYCCRPTSAWEKQRRPPCSCTRGRE